MTRSLIAAAAACALLAGCSAPAGGFLQPRQLDAPAAVSPALAALGVAPNVVSFTVAGAIAPVTASEAGYAGTFVATAPAGCKGIVALLETKLSGPNATFDLKSLKAGKCDVTIADAHGQKAIVRVYVTTTGGSVG